MGKQCPPYVVVAINLFLHNSVAFLSKNHVIQSTSESRTNVGPISTTLHCSFINVFMVALRGKVLFEKMQLFQFYM